MKKNPIIDKLNFIKNGKPTKEEIEKKADKIISSSMKAMNIFRKGIEYISKEYIGE